MISNPPTNKCAAKSRDFGSIEVFYDGDCPICRREIAFLKNRDRKQQIQFTDLQQCERLGSANFPTYRQLMGKIHARQPDGTWITGVEVFRRIYDVIGWNQLVALSRWPVVRSILNWSYTVFAKNRLVLTGRCLDNCETGPSK